MRLKISFDDVKKLFRYLDKNNTGCLGYDEFTLLLEERWRGIDPNQVLKENMKHFKNPMQVSSKNHLPLVKDYPNEEEAFYAIENLARDKTKIPIGTK
jgi:hypothetical protein